MNEDKLIKTSLYMGLFIFCAFGFTFFLLLLGYILSKILLGILFAICLIFIAMSLFLINGFDDYQKEKEE